MKKAVIIYAFVLALVAFGQTAWAQTYITDLLVIGEASQSDASDRYDSFVSQGWTGINHNLNSGTDGYCIYLLYKTNASPSSSGTPITDLYLRVSDSNNASDEFTYDGRTYVLPYRVGNSYFTTTTKGDLNCGADGDYINLYYTKDAFSPGRAVSSIAIDNNPSSTAVGENGGTSPCDLNKGASGDFIYLHMSKSMTDDIVVVYTEAELRDALLLNNANIQLGNDIDINAVLLVNNNRTVTIDLNGYTLDRGLTGHVDAGEVFNVANGSTLNLSNGTVTGGWGDDGGAIQNKGTTNLTGVVISGNVAEDRGGGIGNKSGATLTMTDCTFINNTCNDKTDPRGGGGLFNAEGATAMLTNVTFTGNSVAQYGGAGICNYGTLTLDGCTITGNSAKSDGGGIWTNGTLNIQGEITITGNTIANGQPSNLYLKSGKVVTVTGSLAGSNIGIYMLSTGTFTSGYSTYHSGTDPATIFTSDQNSNVSMDSNGQEAQIDFFYIERGWDEENNVVTKTIRTLAANEYTVLTGGGNINLNPGFYVVKGNVTYDFIYMVDGGEHHLILCDDGVSLNAKHINVEGDNTLHIYGQTKDLGIISIHDFETYTSHAGIGGIDASAGTIVIHGGDLRVLGGYYAELGAEYGGAGIGGGGGGYNSQGAWTEGGGGGGTVIVYGGNVIAEAGSFHAAGIGGCVNGNGGNVTIHGGNVIAVGAYCGAGIGTGFNETDRITSTGSLTVTGGHVEAYGGRNAAGIGGGRDADGSVVTITGGYVYAKGGRYGAGIGSGVEALTSGGKQGGKLTVTGGEVHAYGGADAAGIGGGEDADCGEVIINGGFVYAEGRDGGAGIGGGEEGDGGDVTITGGTVIAKAGKNKTGYRAIGPGNGSDNYGTLTIGNSMMVQAGTGDTYERIFTAPERVNACWYRTSARLEPCTHQGATYTVDGVTASDHHTEHCQYCTTPFQPELHHFENDSCTVCHVNGSISTVSIYLPNIGEGGDYVDGDYQDDPVVYNMVTNSTFNFPAAPEDPQGMDFAGWRDGDASGLNTFIAGDGEALHTVGSSFTISEDVSFTSRFHKVNLFNTAGNWNEPSNWFWNEVPNGSDVVINADAIIPNGYTATADSIAIKDASITIAEGGQLIHNNACVVATVKKSILGHSGNNNGGWNFIASPLADTTQATEVTNLINTIPANYDLYYYDEDDHYWRNYKESDHSEDFGFDLTNGQGYLYANYEDVELQFTGTLQAGSNGSYTVSNLSYACGNENLKGFNLVGNPFACNATITDAQGEAMPFYVINGTSVEANTGSTIIPPCTGVMVKAIATGQTVTFTKVIPNAQTSQSNGGSLQVTLSQVPEPEAAEPSRSIEGPARDNGGVSTGSTTATLDNAIVSFNENDQLEKFRFGDNAQIYIPQGGKDYAIAVSEKKGELPLNFKTNENGSYTIAVNPENMEMGYLHLIDNITGADVDLLVEPSYTFTAKTTDYESRFKLVFVPVCEDADGDNETFAFNSNGNWMISNEGEATLQVIDMTGRILSSETISGSVSKTIDVAPGVYILKLNDKVQKIVIR